MQANLLMKRSPTLPDALRTQNPQGSPNVAIRFICTKRLLCLTAFRTLRKASPYAMTNYVFTHLGCSLWAIY